MGPRVGPDAAKERKISDSGQIQIVESKGF
jgi:hypothetical protein